MFIHIPKTSGTNFRTNIIDTYSKYNYSNYSNEPPFGNLSENQIDEFKKIAIDDLYNEYNNFLFVTKEKNIEFNYKKIFEINHSQNVKHFPLHVWQKHSIYKNHSIFTIARNPYTRFISYYYNISGGLQKHFNIKLTIKEFIKNEYINLISNNFKFMNYKMNQIDFLKNSLQEIVCKKFYRMEFDLNQLSIDFNLPNLTKNKINCGSYNRDYYNLFDSELIDWIKQTYEKDFEYFSYDINPFWI